MIDHYEPHIVTAQDYYPFGMLSRVALPGNDVPYRFGFNGKMNDNDVKGGLGNQQDYGMRIYDPRIGRFLSVDPLTRLYPWYTPYQFAGNTPLQAVDMDGLEPKAAGKEAGEIVHEESGQSWKWDGKTWADNSTMETVTISAPKPLSRNFTEWYSHNTKKYDNRNAAYDAWQSYPGYHNGEGKWDRMFRMMAHGSKETRRDYAFGGYDMFNGLGRASRAANAMEKTAPVMQAAKVEAQLTEMEEHIALGVREVLDRFAKERGATTYHVWGQGNFPKQFLDKINNPAVKIHFSLDGVGNVQKAIEDGAKGFGESHVTSWELYQIYSNPSALKRTTFYLGGIETNPFK